MFNFISKINQFLKLSVIKPAVEKFDNYKPISVSDFEDAHSLHLDQIMRGCMLTCECNVVIDALWGVLNACSSYAEFLKELEFKSDELDRVSVAIDQPGEIIDYSLSEISRLFQKKLGQFKSLLTAQSIVANERTVLLEHLKIFS